MRGESTYRDIIPFWCGWDFFINKITSYCVAKIAVIVMCSGSCMRKKIAVCKNEKNPIDVSIGLNMAVKEGFEPSIRLQTVYSLSRGAPSASRPPHRKLCSGALGRIRTSDRLVRSQVLYPAELRAHRFNGVQHKDFPCALSNSFKIMKIWSSSAYKRQRRSI